MYTWIKLLTFLIRENTQNLSTICQLIIVYEFKKKLYDVIFSFAVRNGAKVVFCANEGK